MGCVDTCTKGAAFQVGALLGLAKDENPKP